jgi:soluble lytic murein transglycosylase-like protein
VALLAAAMLLLSTGAVNPDEETTVLAASVGVDPVALQGAVNSTGVAPAAYLASEGLLDPPATHAPPAPAPSSTRVACIIRVESRGDAHAVNPRSGAAGLGQFLSSTWKTTPQGRAGLSVYDPAANTAAINWMISVGRAREFVAVSAGYC